MTSIIKRNRRSHGLDESSNYKCYTLIIWGLVDNFQKLEGDDKSPVETTRLSYYPLRGRENTITA